MKVEVTPDAKGMLEALGIESEEEKEVIYDNVTKWLEELKKPSEVLEQINKLDPEPKEFAAYMFVTGMILTSMVIKAKESVLSAMIMAGRNT